MGTDVLFQFLAKLTYR